MKIIDENPKALPIFSYSKISSYKSCPKAYKFIYIDKLPRLDKPYFVFGSFAHSILEKFHKEFIDGSKDPIEIVMKKSFISALKEFKLKLTKEQIDEVFAIMQTYLDKLSQQDKFPNVLSVEKKIWIELDNEIIFNGFIDRIQMDRDNVLHITDYKTTKNEKYLTDRTQLLLYAYIMYLENKDLDKIRTSYMMLKHGMKLLEKDHNIDELIIAKNKLLEQCIIAKNDKLYRAKPSNFSCNFCDFLDRCDEGKALIYKKAKFGQIDW